jgi:hypothetical protein
MKRPSICLLLLLFLTAMHINHKIRQGVLGDWFEIRPARDCSIKSHDNQEIDTMDAKSITSLITLQPKLLYLLHNTTHTLL